MNNCSHLQVQSDVSVDSENVANEFGSPNNGSAINILKYDYEGAMKFTVAVVLVYGIGVILLLGFYTKRSPQQVFQEKEGNKFIKDLTANKRTLEKKYVKSKIVDLIRNIHTVPVEDIHEAIPLSSCVHKVTSLPNCVHECLVPCSLEEVTETTTNGGELIECNSESRSTD